MGAAVPAALEATISYTEPPYWYDPVRQTLGAVRLQAGDAQGAQEVFNAALSSHPGNAWALWGLAEVARRGGAQELEQDAADRFDRAWLGDGAPALNRA